MDVRWVRAVECAGDRNEDAIGRRNSEEEELAKEDEEERG